jgi:hypothetical protein
VGTDIAKVCKVIFRQKETAMANRLNQVRGVLCGIAVIVGTVPTASYGKTPEATDPKAGTDVGTPATISGKDLPEKGLAVETKSRPGAAIITYTSKISREAAIERLRGDYSLEGVARRHVEVEFDDLRGLSQPMTQRTTIQAKNHPDAVFVHPDLSIVLGAPADSYVVGFALGNPARLPAAAEATHELHKGYQPIVKSRWQTGGLTLEQVAFGLLPADEAVRSGTEKQDVIVRITVTNDSDAPTTSALVLLVGKAAGSQFENYAAFRAPVSRWQQEKMKVADVQRSLMVEGNVLLTYRTSAPTPVAIQPKLEVVQGPSKQPIHVNNGLRFELQLKPRETRYLDFVMAGSSKLYPATERSRMAADDFQEALRKAESRWDRALESGMKLSTPEPRLNNIYKHLVLSCLENVPKEPNVPWVLPLHSSGYAGGVWPCEFLRVSVPLDSLGFSKDMEPCLRWFTEHQSGVGKYGNKDIGPDGEITSTHGCFVGANSPRWTCETGVVLWMLGSHYRYSRDAAWLKANRASVLAACDWIQKQRDTTRTTGADGKRVAHFGLLPKGRAHDWPGRLYYYSCSDAYTCKGMAEAAAALRDAGAPEADRLSAAADEYRRCILDTLHQVAYKDPDTGLLFVPNSVYFRQADRESRGVWLLDGPLLLFDARILHPVADAKYWQPMLEIVQRKWGVLGGLMCHFSTDDLDQWKSDPDSPFWYVLAAEMVWHADFLARGELEKALLVFYSSLVYGMSEDMFETIERVNVAESNYAPFQPNSSGNGRVLIMLRRMVIDEQDEAQGKLWLLRGCPRRWFAPGKSISVTDAPTVFGKTALHTTCTEHAITIDIDPPADPAMKHLCVAVRHPTRQKPRKVTLDEANTTIEGEIVTVNAPTGHLRIVAEYD